MLSENFNVWLTFVVHITSLLDRVSRYFQNLDEQDADLNRAVNKLIELS